MKCLKKINVMRAPTGSLRPEARARPIALSLDVFRDIIKGPAIARPSGMLCKAMANAMRRPKCVDPIVESATAIPSGKLWHVSVMAVMIPNLLSRRSDDSSALLNPPFPIRFGPYLLAATTTANPAQQHPTACERLRVAMKGSFPRHPH